MSKLSVTIGIPAYNEAVNIANLLTDLKNQQPGAYVLKQILVYSDGSTDTTCSEVKKARNPKIKLICAPTRQGVAKATNFLFFQANCDVFVFLNADIRIPDPNFLNKITGPFLTTKVDLVSCRLLELPPVNFIEKVLFAGMQYKNWVFDHIRGGQNVYTCYGQIRAFSRPLYKKIVFRSLIADDIYSYLFAVKHGFIFQSIKSITAYYKLPNNLADHLKQSLRFFHSANSFGREFSPRFLKTHLPWPPTLFIIGAMITLFRFPVYLPAYLSLTLVAKLLSLKQSKNGLDEQWKMSPSTKILSTRL